MFKMKKLILIIILIFIFLITGCKKESGRVSITSYSVLNNAVSFIETDNEVCKQDDKPIIRLFATSWCPHCQWIKDTYIKVVNDYVNQKKIVAYYWEVDKNDDLLTKEKEDKISESELEIFKEFNPRQSIPTFVFGCKYYRIGNAHEAQNDLASEESEFRSIIDRLIGGEN